MRGKIETTVADERADHSDVRGGEALQGRIPFHWVADGALLFRRIFTLG